MTCNEEGISAGSEQRNEGSRGLGDFQRRSNRLGGKGWKGEDRRREAPTPRDRPWESTPLRRDQAPSVRVPNVGWDATPRDIDDLDSGYNSTRDRTWDATPRTATRNSQEDSPLSSSVPVDAHEWEEEQLRLDRDWYLTSESGGVAGDDENNPLAMYDDLDQQRQQEMASKRVVGYTSQLLSEALLKHFLALEKGICETGAICKQPSYVVSLKVFLSSFAECGQRSLGSKSDANVWGRNTQSPRFRFRGRF